MLQKEYEWILVLQHTIFFNVVHVKYKTQYTLLLNGYLIWKAHEILYFKQ